MSRKWILRFLCVLLSPVLFFALLECLLRWTGVGFPTGFLVPDKIGGQPVYVDNQFFGYRFFPQRMTRTPAPIVIQSPKPAGTFRVFVLGESAAMGEPQKEFGAVRMLEILLKERFPERRIEVINAAMTAINSHVIREIARDAARLEPDVFVIYMGNNEVVGPYGPGTVLTDVLASPRWTRLRVLATRLRTAWLLRRASALFRVDDDGGVRWSGMEMFVRRKVPADDPRLEVVYESFAANLSDIMRIARDAGVEVLLSTVSVNERDCPPFSGDDSFQRARSAEATGDVASARQLYQRAVDNDALRFRADNRINQIIRDAASRFSRHVRFVDAEADFAELGTNGVAGRESFLDHVHFTFEGNYKLACLWLEAIAARPDMKAMDSGRNLTSAECADRLIFTPWNELNLADMMIMRRRNPPFSAQEGNSQRISELILEKMEASRAIAQVNLGELTERFDSAMRASPGDVYIPAGAAEVMLNSARYKDAERYLHQALKLAPYRLDLQGGLALVLGYEGRAKDGVELLLHDAKRHGHYPADLLLSAAQSLTRDKRLDDALVFAKAAHQKAPRLTDAALQEGEILFAQGKQEEAQKVFEAVLKQEPDNIGATADLAALLVRQEKWDDADMMFRKFIEKYPGLVDARIKYAEFLLLRGDFASAATTLQRLERDEPNLAKPRYLSGQLAAMKGDWDASAAALEESLRLQADARTAYDLARIHLTLHHDARARELLDQAAGLAPDNFIYAHSLAWTLATHPNESIRDPDKAVVFAERASELTRHRDARTEDTLAAAYAASGRFNDARETAAEARKLALDANDEELAARIRSRLALYEQGHPYIEKLTMPGAD